MNLSTSELFRIYHFVYTAYWDEGYVVCFTKMNVMTMFQKINDDRWHEYGSAELKSGFKFNVRSVSDSAALLVHDLRKPLV